MIVDAHLDIAWNALWHGRGFDSPSPPGYVVNRRDLSAAGYGLVLASVFTAPQRPPGMASLVPYGYRTAREAHLLGRSELGYYASLGLPLITTREQLRRHVRGWRRGRLAAILAMENADPVETPAQVRQWASWGVRVIGPAWSRTRYCGGTNAPGGITPAGRRLLAAMRRHGIILDVSHMADRSLRDTMELWRGTFVATHAGARALCARQRQLPDDVIAELGRREGMIGISLYSGHLRLRGRAGIADVVRHALHVARVAGDPGCVGLGSDLDGGFAVDRAAVRSLADLRPLRSALARAFGKEDAEGIMGGNWIRFLERTLPHA